MSFPRSSYLLVQQSISLLPASTRVFPVASVAFSVSSEKVGMTVDLTQLIVAAAALSAAVSHLPNKLVNIRFVSMRPPGQAQRDLSTATFVETPLGSERLDRGPTQTSPGAQVY